MLSHRRSILGLAPGTGKTPTTLAALREAGPWRSLLVVPKSVIPHWADLAEVWYPELLVIDGTGSTAARRWARDRVAEMPDQPVALLLNYEVMRNDVVELASVTWGALVLDEAHRCKNRKALVTKAAKRLARHPRMWVWLVSGTPIPNRPTEAWSLLNLLDPHRFSSYWRWVREYCDTEVQHYWSSRNIELVTGLKEGAVERIGAELADVLHYRTLEELLPDLPPATLTAIPVTLDAEEERIYLELERRAWTEITDGMVLETHNTISRMTRLRQVLSDVEVLGAQRDRPGTKIAAAVEMIVDLEPEQVVVLTWTRAAAERVAAETGGAFIHGGVHALERAAAMVRFKEGTTRVLCGTTDTLGEGVDGMQVAHHLIRLDRSWTPSRNEQSVARLRRSGQSRAVFVWDLVSHIPGRQTMDQVVEKALREKVSILEELLSARPAGV